MASAQEQLTALQAHLEQQMNEQLTNQRREFEHKFEVQNNILRQHLEQKNQDPAPAPAKPTKEPRVPDVPPFEGNPKKSFEFLSQLNIFFRLQPTRFESDINRSYYLGTCCVGPAATWFANGANSLQVLEDFSVFVAQFNTIFKDPTKQEDAERRLLSFKQGKRSVAHMLPEF
jgi:hypothetical protein